MNSSKNDVRPSKSFFPNPESEKRRGVFFPNPEAEKLAMTDRHASRASRLVQETRQWHGIDGFLFTNGSSLNMKCASLIAIVMMDATKVQRWKSEKEILRNGTLFAMVACAQDRSTAFPGAAVDLLMKGHLSMIIYSLYQLILQGIHRECCEMPSNTAHCASWRELVSTQSGENVLLIKYIFVTSSFT